MRQRRELPAEIIRVLSEQDGVMTTHQAKSAGVTRDQLRALHRAGWKNPTRGVWVSPHAPDPFRASLRTAVLTCETGALGGISAARLHRQWGLPQWSSQEQPELLLPAGATYHRRTGVVRRSGLRQEDLTEIDGFPVSSLSRTVRDMAARLAPDDLVCLVDSALRSGWEPTSARGLTGRESDRLAAALALADRRSESALETYLRLLLVRAGLPPEALQWELKDPAGQVYARLDFAWPSIRLAIEADGRAHHDDLTAAYRDRARANAVTVDGWRILRFTWFDVQRRPGWVIAQVRAAISGSATRPAVS